MADTTLRPFRCATCRGEVAFRIHDSRWVHLVTEVRIPEDHPHASSLALHNMAGTVLDPTEVTE